MAKKLTFEITTQERTVFKDEVDQVSLPTEQGEITILPHHIPLVSNLVAGELKIKKGDETIYMAVSGGFIEVQSHKVTILADMAERAEEIDLKKAQEAKIRAQKLLEEKRGAERVDFTAIAAKLEKELVRIKVAERRRATRVQRVMDQEALKEKSKEDKDKMENKL